MSLTRAAARIAAFVVVLLGVIALYNFAAYSMVRQALSQAKTTPIQVTPFKTNFGEGSFKGLDDYLYKPERGRRRN